MADGSDRAILRRAVRQAADEGRNVLPDATDDQAHIIEAWAAGILKECDVRR